MKTEIGPQIQLGFSGAEIDRERRHKTLLPGEVTVVTESLAQAKQRYLDHYAKYGCFPIEGATAGSWTFTTATRTNLFDGTFDLDTDTFKIALFLSTSNIGGASTTFAGLTNEHAGANGYTAGGVATTLSLSGTTTVTVAFTATTWTASGGSIIAKWAVLYEVSGNVLAYFLLESGGADVTTTTGNQLQITAGTVATLA